MGADGTGARDPRDAPVSERVRVRRKPDRGRYDRSTIDAILDAALVGHVAWVLDGQPYATPTAIWRQGDDLYWHGSSGSRMIRATMKGAPVCVTATILDGLVLARSAANHSVNYRSVMVLGHARLVDDERLKLAALEAFVEHLYPGRWAALRPATRAELYRTLVLSIDLREASAKIRTGPPADEPDDMAWPIWAGVVPIGLVAGVPEPAEDITGDGGVALPAYLPAAGARVERG